MERFFIGIHCTFDLKSLKIIKNHYSLQELPSDRYRLVSLCVTITFMDITIITVSVIITITAEAGAVTIFTIIVLFVILTHT